ncbi:MAG: FtsX-like permease family protein [Deltaproteobacteria bacterium]|nr:FtsX-like permease family protein [Deltaproteobacteria bacterium]
MLAFKLAYRNLVGKKLRAWLNVSVLSFTYVLIIWHQGLFSGMYRQAAVNSIKDEIGSGQYWHEKYDPFDPLTLEDAHGPLTPELSRMITDGKGTAILVRQGTIYPEGRVQSILLKGIDPNQEIVELPAVALDDGRRNLPVMVGKAMARRNSLNVGDEITIRWRDAKGTFDAAEGEIVSIMTSDVPTVDVGQLWLPLERLRDMTGLKGEATIVTVHKDAERIPPAEGWIFRDHDYLLKDIIDIVKSKRVGGAILYSVLLFLAMLAIFDTQVLAIFRRRKEIGTLMALGMTRGKVILIFTLEGMMNGILAIVIGAIYGIPLLYISAKYGIPLPYSGEDWGMAIAARLFPVYSVTLVGITVVIIMTTVTIVSYLPSRKISGMKPTEAIKGKLS